MTFQPSSSAEARGQSRGGNWAAPKHSMIAFLSMPFKGLVLVTTKKIKRPNEKTSALGLGRRETPRQ
eukprot:CAMPEP_0117494042 /NCGR_PEP_ID=MMETSP0784-20121206/19407_1 /TAXON_ID=39447 /ORGANISM="" /LENGTH=66 /DNA_ID=CAMNT_0005288909 /DNA_START=476 /DNA_END=676 /DNA_ORIENTATION=-